MNKVEMGISAGLLALSAAAGSAASAEAYTAQCKAGIDVLQSYNNQTVTLRFSNATTRQSLGTLDIKPTDKNIKKVFPLMPSNGSLGGVDIFAFKVEQPGFPPEVEITSCGNFREYTVPGLVSSVSSADQQTINTLTSERDQARSQLSDAQSKLRDAQNATAAAENKLADALKSLGAADASWRKYAFGAGGLALGVLIGLGIGRWRRRTWVRVDPAGNVTVNRPARVEDTITPGAIPPGGSTRRII